MVETPYQRWNKSLNKYDMRVMYDVDGVSDPIILGTVLIDLDAPCDVLRECVERAFRDKLNETVGDSFQFAIQENNKSLSRTLEKKTLTKTYAPFKMNNRTMEGAYTITLVKEKGKKKVFIPEFPPDAADDMLKLAVDG